VYARRPRAAAQAQHSSMSRTTQEASSPPFHARCYRQILREGHIDARQTRARIRRPPFIDAAEPLTMTTDKHEPTRTIQRTPAMSSDSRATRQ
jgi:hypothetical protein